MLSSLLLVQPLRVSCTWRDIWTQWFLYTPQQFAGV